MLSLRALTINNFPRLLGIRPGEAARIGFMAAFLFFLLAANNVIKIVRDSLFLSRFRDNSAALCLSFGRGRRRRRHSHLFSLRIEVFTFADDSWFTRFHYF